MMGYWIRSVWNQEIEGKTSWVRKIVKFLIDRNLISAEDMRVVVSTTPEGLRRIAHGLLLAASKAEETGVIGHYAPAWPIRFAASPAPDALGDLLYDISFRPPGQNRDGAGNLKPQGPRARWLSILEDYDVTAEADGPSSAA